MESNKFPGVELYDEVISLLNDFYDLDHLKALILELDDCRQYERPLNLVRYKPLDRLINTLTRFSKNIKDQDLYGSWEGHHWDFETKFEKASQGNKNE